MRLSLSKEDFEGSQLEPLPSGDYTATIQRITHKKKAGADADNPGYLEVPFRIDDTPDGTPRVITRRYSLLPQARWAIGVLARAAGIKGEGDEVDFDTEDLEGAEVTVRVGVRVGEGEYEGRKFNEIERVLPTR